MNGIMNYVDNLMVNHPLDTEYMYTQSSEDMIFGGKLDEQKGLGGFPPIYICDKSETTDKSPFEEEVSVKREYSKLKTSVTIKDIMEERKNIKPFITLS